MPKGTRENIADIYIESKEERRRIRERSKRVRKRALH
jgi:hypothetical protein